MTKTYPQTSTYTRRRFLAGAGALVVAIGAPRLLNPKDAFAVLENDFPIGQPVDRSPNCIEDL